MPLCLGFALTMPCRHFTPLHRTEGTLAKQVRWAFGLAGSFRGTCSGIGSMLIPTALVTWVVGTKAKR